MTEKNALVSIIVITYNSAQYVIETLESAKSQTYQNIELIVSDDCSSDDTLVICEKWIEDNADRFVRTELITAPLNTGIPANCNRGVNASQGVWVKLIAGDDILLANCIEECINFTNTDEGIEILNGNLIVFNELGENLTSIENLNFFSTETSSNEQYKYLLRYNRVMAPGVFLKKKLIIENGGFDELFPLIEDYPMWLKITASGRKIYCLSKHIVKYRKTDSGLSSPINKINQKIFPSWVISSQEVRLKYCFNDLPYIEKINLKFEIFVRKLIINLNNENNFFNNKIYKFTKIFNPFIIYRKLLKIFNRNYIYNDFLK